MENPKLKIQNAKFYIGTLIFTFYILNFLGCAAITEGAKGIVGVSTKVLEDKRKDAVKKTFSYDYNTCSKKVEEKISRIGAYIYARDAKKKMLAVYVTEEDTTPVGIFFQEIDANNTQVEVSSASTYAKEFISAKIFSGLGNSLNPPEDKP